MPVKQKTICHYIDKSFKNLKLMRVTENFYIHPDCNDVLIPIIKTECIKQFDINESNSIFSAIKLLEYAQDNIHNIKDKYDLLS